MTFDPMSVEVTCVTLPKDHCVQVPWQYINVCGYGDQFCKLPHTYTYYKHTYYIIHTTYRMSDHIVSYWAQFRREKSLFQFNSKGFVVAVHTTAKSEFTASNLRKVTLDSHLATIMWTNKPIFSGRILIFFSLPYQHVPLFLHTDYNKLIIIIVIIIIRNWRSDIETKGESLVIFDEPQWDHKFPARLTTQNQYIKSLQLQIDCLEHKPGKYMLPASDKRV